MMQERTTLKKISPFGFISGLATICCFLNPAVGLGILIFFDIDTEIATYLFIALALLIRFTGDWLFWTQMVPHELNFEKTSEHWSSLFKKNDLLSQPDTNKAIVDMVIDFA